VVRISKGVLKNGLLKWVVLIWIVCVLGAPKQPLWAAEPLVIGQVVPLSGVLAVTGQQAALGGKIYFDWVNTQGGVHGAHIRHEVHDDGYKVTETVRLTRQLLERPEVVALFGFIGTANISQLLKEKVLERAGVALVAPYTGGEELRTPFNPWIFHIRASYAEEAERIVEHSTIGMTRIAVVYQNDGFGKAGLTGVKNALAKRGLQLLGAIPYERNTKNVAQAVQTVQAMDRVQAVILVATGETVGAFVKQYRQSGGFAQLYGVSVIDPQLILEIAGDSNVRGMGISQVVPYPFQPGLSVVREYLQLLQKYAPDASANYTSFEEFLGAKILVEALRRAGPVPTRAKVLHALESLHNFDLGGIVMGFSPTNRVGSHFIELTVIGAQGKLFK